MLLEKQYKVIVYDLFMFGEESLRDCASSPNLKIVKGDIRDEASLREVMKEANAIIHLAAIVGFPACSKNPELAITTNIDGTRNIVDNLQSHQKLIFSSTGSCYGAVEDGLCTEETPINPLSLYGTSKAEGEELVRQASGVILRLATIFGVSKRFRYDLLINHLVYKAINEKKFDIFEAQFRRTFLHVKDVARAFIFAIEHYDEMCGSVYNVGSESLNYSKMDICNIIKEIVSDCVITPSENGTDPDKRDYEVSYKKINKLGYRTTIGVREGIQELIKSYNQEKIIQKEL